ncbi:MAG TPA: UPF0182 family protein [Jiangellaceae bacterium]|nr:UPF0182 family protein [Jiangellaceae bacterium]
MSDFPRPADPFRGRTSTGRRSRALIPTLVVLAVIAVLYGVSVNLITEQMWFESVGFTNVWSTRLLTQAGLFVVGGVVMAASVVLNAMIAYRLRPRYRPLSVEQQSLDRYRDAIDPVRKWVIIVAAILIGLIAGGSASSNWETFLLWRNGRDFGIEDPQFNTDIGFFAFNWPWWRFLVSFGFAVVVIGLITAAITYYVYGAIRLQTAGERVTPAAQAHLSVLIGLFVLLKAAAYWLDRYNLLISDGQIGQNPFTGAGYTDINALLPAKIILVFIALICAVLFFVNVWMRNWLLPGISLGLLVLSAILLGGLWPFLVQSFQVRPSELSRQQPYLQRNIDATRDAYEVADAQTLSYNATVTVEAGQLEQDAESIPGIRLVDPNVVSATFTQQQQVRGFYTFPELLDVDRYELDDETRDIVIAAREIDINRLPSGQQNWINRHTTFTHGFGVVAAYGNARQPSGAPVWAEEDIPARGDITDELGDYEPRIYFGENSPDYSIVGAPKDSDPVEFDIPIGSGDGEAQNEPITYEGDGGVAIGSFFQRLLFATKFQETSILLTDRINSESVILYDRHPRTRLEKVAPWLTVDGDPYPAVVGNRVVWIMDGYTTLNSYPYSQRVSIEEATSDSRIVLPGVVAQPQDHINYIRNSVKAVVDAYDGTVELYAWDDKDPVLKTWMAAFPDTVEPKSAISDELMAHLRYPQDLFKIQRELLSQYHVTNASTFYEGQDRWVVPEDPANPNFAQPVYYQSIRMPETDAPTFSLTTTYTPVARENLAGFMAVNADAHSDEYGQIQVLRLPGDTQVDGPGQVANRFESDPSVATELSLLRQGGAETITGNLLTLPVGGGLMYVQPVYVQQSGATAATFPVLRRVLVSFGERVGFASTLQEALDDVFLGEAGIDTGEPETVAEDVPPVEGEPPAEEETPPAEEETPPPVEEEPPPVTGETPQELIDAAQQAFDEAQAAQRAGDWAAYGEALQRLEDALNRLAEIEGG